jgi:hypothetical protein
MLFSSGKALIDAADCEKGCYPNVNQTFSEQTRGGH